MKTDFDGVNYNYFYISLFYYSIGNGSDILYYYDHLIELFENENIVIYRTKKVHRPQIWYKRVRRLVNYFTPGIMTLCDIGELRY